MIVLFLAFLQLTQPPVRLGDIERAMRTPGVTVKTTWMFCGEPNAYYSHAEREVIMCRELVGLPEDFVRFAYAHELAHAIIMQRDLPYTGSHEVAADELAAVMLLTAGVGGPVTGAGRYWGERASDIVPWDDHPDDDSRAWNLLRILIAHTQQSDEWTRLRSTWTRLLACK